MPHWQVWTLESLPVQKNSRISLFVIPSTVGDPVKFLWSVATVVLSGRQLGPLLIDWLCHTNKVRVIRK
jgi:hypothetical protein